MSETNSKSPVWDKIVATYRAGLSSAEEFRRMELHFPQFLSYDLDGSALRIGVAEELQKEWFSQLYAKPLEAAIKTAGLGDGISVVFEVAAKNEVNSPANVVSTIKEEKSDSQRKPQAKDTSPHRSRALPSTLPLHETYTFSNFVRGPSNSFAYAAAIAVAKGLGRTAYNPLFIWGSTGLGKTHLMEAIGHHVMENNPDVSVCYITSETFLNEYLNAMANAALPKFRARYRKYDLLLLDDVQFLVGKKQFQEEFFNTFTQLMIFNKQIVMTCDVAPKELGLEDRLISRFQQGMVVEIESPSYETRIAILKSKMQGRNRVIPNEILGFIAENIRSHVRAIEGALSRIINFIDINPEMPINLEIAQHLLKDMIEDEATIKKITPETVIQAVADHYGINVKEIIGPGRPQSLITPRQMAMFLSCKLTTDSLPDIGKVFDRKHTTVYYGSQQIQKRLSVEADLKQDVQQIAAKLGRNISDVLE